ncbi:hypothetical protein FRUB_07817 [Fimbriiglobus ruber]|uniref:Uncharacterized protein n=1 Tax=Fimbriiglobus ruber TaxID=1908690 RepID=A0A225DRE3_9BACT|nr:hypothetical protein FRUB_07817 [Fimbriiglobus ruber]
MGTVPDSGVGGAAVVVEKVQVFRWGETDTRHGSAPTENRGGNS